jgi:hypothetical protein
MERLLLDLTKVGDDVDERTLVPSNHFPDPFRHPLKPTGPRGYTSRLCDFGTYKLQANGRMRCSNALAHL